MKMETVKVLHETFKVTDLDSAKWNKGEGGFWATVKNNYGQNCIVKRDTMENYNGLYFPSMNNPL